MQDFESKFLEENGYFLPHIQTMFKGKRYRAIHDEIYPREQEETFHEFLIHIFRTIFGQEWVEEQIKLPEKNRHFVIQCHAKYIEWLKKNANTEEKEKTGRYSGQPDGYTQWPLCLAYDLYSLKHTNYLNDEVLAKLKKNDDEFQGARYEIAIAAIFARANFEIEHYDEHDPKTISKKHGEFIATNKTTKQKIVVEAKSKRRIGVFHYERDKEKTDEKEIKANVHNLLKKAMTKETDNLPYVTFIDVNAPQTPNLEMKDKPWLKDIFEAAKQHTEPVGIPAKANLIAFTNWSYHYQAEETATRGETLYSISLNPAVPLDKESLDRIMLVCNKYSAVPDLDKICEMANEIQKKLNGD